MANLPDLADQNQKEEIVRALQQGADANEKDLSGFTAFYYACAYNITDIIEILLENKSVNVNYCRAI